jgi:hypothetical protein
VIPEERKFVINDFSAGVWDGWKVVACPPPALADFFTQKYAGKTGVLWIMFMSRSN